ncbi:MAG: NTP transferase domain-containing protein, partial [Candidatus Eremiobacteraeota bacterium]|nr:NTP transferase domain-containing protein [Candidatus Eremiobacteraeota bacterium]
MITAGGRVGPPLCSKIGTTVKALAVIRGTTMLERAIIAAREAGADRVAVVCGDEARAKCAPLIDHVIREKQSGAENVRSALSAFAGDVLYLSSDLPFISAQVLRDFLDRVPRGAIAMPLADAAAYESRFPGAPSHATVVGHERVANGSVFMLPAGAAHKIISVAERFFDARKSLPRMAVLLGPQMLIKYGLKRLRITDIEQRATRVLGLRALAIRDCAPELCYDI